METPQTTSRDVEKPSSQPDDKQTLFARQLEESEQRRKAEQARMKKVVEQEVLRDLKEYHLEHSKKVVGDPRKMINKKIADRLSEGKKLFNRDFREFINRKGFIKLLNKIRDSNFTLRQIKNGCSTLFDKDFMKLKYTNPHLTNDELISMLTAYFESTKPQRFWDDMEKSDLFQQSQAAWNQQSLFNNSSVSIGSLESLGTARDGSKMKPAHTQFAAKMDSIDLIQGALHSTRTGQDSAKEEEGHHIRRKEDILINEAARQQQRKMRQNHMIEVDNVLDVHEGEQTVGTFKLPKFDSKFATLESSVENFEQSPMKKGVRNAAAFQNQTVTNLEHSHLASLDQHPAKTLNLPSMPQGVSKSLNIGFPLKKTTDYGSISSFRRKGRAKKNIFQTSVPHPMSTIDRQKNQDVEKKLRFPVSPAFVNNYSLAKTPKMKPVVDYCHQKNIPFKVEEARFYKINQAKQMHRQFTRTMNHFFETNRPSEYDTAIGLLSAEEAVPREETGYVNELYSDTRPIYMPPAGAEIMNKIQWEQEERRQLAKKQKLREELERRQAIAKMNTDQLRNLGLLGQDARMSLKIGSPQRQATFKKSFVAPPSQNLSTEEDRTGDSPTMNQTKNSEFQLPQLTRMESLRPSVQSKKSSRNFKRKTVSVNPEGKQEAYLEFMRKFETKRDTSLKKLNTNLGNPYSGKLVSQSRGNSETLEDADKEGKTPLSDHTEAKEENEHKKKPEARKKKRTKRDPITKILKTNQRVVKFKRIENKKLLRILERIELDKPILMHDKLDIIWDKDGTEKVADRENMMKKQRSPAPSMHGSKSRTSSTWDDPPSKPRSRVNSSKMWGSNQTSQKQLKKAAKLKTGVAPQSFNQYQVKTELERLKLDRSIGNKKQIRAYNRMLQYIDQREIRFHSGKRSEKILMHEKEREFFDCIRLIIQNGYMLNQSDMCDILRFIQLHEVFYFSTPEQDLVIQFLKDSVRAFGFSKDIVDQVIAENQSQQINMLMSSTDQGEFLSDKKNSQNASILLSGHPDPVLKSSILEQDMQSPDASQLRKPSPPLNMRSLHDPNLGGSKEVSLFEIDQARGRNQSLFNTNSSEVVPKGGDSLMMA